MLSEIKRQELLRKIKREVYKNPHETYYGLYKDYSDCKGVIYRQEDNIYMIVTSSITYANQLQENGYNICMQVQDCKIINSEK